LALEARPAPDEAEAEETLWLVWEDGFFVGAILLILEER